MTLQRQRRGVRRAWLRPPRREQLGGAGPVDVGDGPDAVRCRCSSRRRACRRSTPRGRWPSRGRPPRAAPRWASARSRLSPWRTVTAVNPADAVFQLYWAGTREQIRARLDRARAAGATGLIVTARLDLLALTRLGQPGHPRADGRQDDAALRPRGAAAAALAVLTGREPAAHPISPCPTWRRPASPRRRSSAPTASGCMTPAPSWDDLRWLREQWDGPFMLKGVMRVDDARRAAEIGASAISVSNHGGNNLDGTPATIRALPAIADAVGDAGRGGAGRRRPSRQRRDQGARARSPRGHDRAGLPVGPGRQRPGRGGERAGRPAQRDRLRADGSRATVRGRADARRRPRARRDSSAAWARRTSPAAVTWPRETRVRHLDGARPGRRAASAHPPRGHRAARSHASGHLKLDEIITARYSLEEVNEGYRDLLAGKNVRGVILHES